MAFLDLLERFQVAILEKNTDIILPEIKNNPQISPQKQLEIYIEGYRIRLLEAISADYPLLFEYLGEEKFNSLALEYVERNPPVSYNLDIYPHQFSNFLQDRIDEDAKDIARLESTIAEIFTLEDSANVPAEYFVQMHLEEFSTIQFLPRKSARLIELEYNVEECLSKFRANGYCDIPKRQKTYLYIYRHKNNVIRKVLNKQQFKLLNNLFNGLSLNDAFEEFSSEELKIISDNIQKWFQSWIEDGLFRK